MSEDTRRRYFADETPASRAAEVAGKGGGIGLGVGAALGAIVATASAITVPGLGLVVAGPLAGAIAGAGTGAAAGTVLGAMVGSTIPKDRVADYEKAVKEGDVVMSARARDAAHAAEIEQEMTRARGRGPRAARRSAASRMTRQSPLDVAIVREAASSRPLPLQLPPWAVRSSSPTLPTMPGSLNASSSRSSRPATRSSAIARS
jgi:hypothetical protein